ncbi:MAG: DUF4920 domain-containing protein [Bacteroidetes bacterium]|jgi:hypothetical protein|nr:DUF4920 domain-containing protein [Bacteroidota bacterium]
MRTQYFTILFGALLVLNSCGNAEKQDHDDHSGHDHATMEVAASGNFGEEISKDDAIDVVEAIAQITADTTNDLKIKGEIVEVCQHSGCWITMDMGNGETLMVNMLDHAYEVPKDAAGKSVWVEGVAVRELIPVEMLKHYARDAGRSQEEINAISKPEWKYTVDARGVIIE